MPEENKNLEAENKKLKEALCQIARHIDVINKIIEENKDFFRKTENGEKEHVTEDELKGLLKKYSRLHD